MNMTRTWKRHDSYRQFLEQELYSVSWFQTLEWIQKGIRAAFLQSFKEQNEEKFISRMLDELHELNGIGRVSSERHSKERQLLIDLIYTRLECLKEESECRKFYHLNSKLGMDRFVSQVQTLKKASPARIQDNA